MFDIFVVVSERRPRGMDLRQLFLVLLQAVRPARSEARLQPDVNVSSVFCTCLTTLNSAHNCIGGSFNQGPGAYAPKCQAALIFHRALAQQCVYFLTFSSGVLLQQCQNPRLENKKSFVEIKPVLVVKRRNLTILSPR